MGRADEYQFDYLDDNGRFADQMNGALFHGRQMVRPEELEPADALLVYKAKEAGRRKNYKSVVDAGNPGSDCKSQGKGGT